MAPHHWILMARYFTEQKDESEAVTAIKSFSQFRSLSNPNAEPHHTTHEPINSTSFRSPTHSEEKRISIGATDKPIPVAVELKVRSCYENAAKIFVSVGAPYYVVWTYPFVSVCQFRIIEKAGLMLFPLRQNKRKSCCSRAILFMNINNLDPGVVSMPYFGILGGVNAELQFKVGVSIDVIQYSWIWFWEKFKIQVTIHSMLLVSILLLEAVKYPSATV
ncbi:hypothetical protein ACSQ67_000532 [Phaseolus vulgaris]